MSNILFIHNGLSQTTWLFFLIVGLWGTVRAIRGSGIDGHYLGAVATGQLLFVIQAVLGAILWFTTGSGGIARPGIHLLYGVFALLFAPFIYLAVLKGDESNRAQWILAFTALFLFGIAVRAIATAQSVF